MKGALGVGRSGVSPLALSTGVVLPDDGGVLAVHIMRISAALVVQGQVASHALPVALCNAPEAAGSGRAVLPPSLVSSKSGIGKHASPVS
jgi:hypothetical protein